MTAPPIALMLQNSGGASLLESLTFGNLARIGVLLAIVWLAIKGAERVLVFLSDKVPRARFFFKRLAPVVRITLWFVSILAVIEILAPTQQAFVAGVAAIGLALGLGAQDLVKNVIGGLIVLTDRPYQLGDRVRIGDAYGEIDHIGLRSTKLTTNDDTRVTIPNADILDSQVFNSNSGVPDCQVVTDLCLPFNIDPDELVRVGREIAFTSPYLLSRKPVAVRVSDELAEQPYTQLRIKAYVYDHRFERAMQSDLTVRAKREFRKRNWLRNGFEMEDECPGPGRPIAGERQFPKPDPAA